MPPDPPGEPAPGAPARPPSPDGHGTPGAGERDVWRVGLPDREVVVVGTAHISRESVELVRRVIAEERPDRVCIELDERRFQALTRPQHFEGLDLRELIRTRQLATLLVNLVLAGYQRSLGIQLGVRPGSELLEAARAAEAAGIPVDLCDRDIRITLRRAWGSLSLWERARALSGLVAGMIEGQELDEEALRALREQDVLSRLLDELGRELPRLKVALIDERDAYLAEGIRRAEGRRLVAVVGAGHVQGILRELRRAAPVDRAELDVLPPPSRFWKVLGWAVPAFILAALAWIGLRRGAGAAGADLGFWILANGVPCALGAVAALAHPVTVASAFLAAPVTSLTPIIGAGYVTAFVQAWLRPPYVREFAEVVDDLRHPAGWWRNRLLRVLLVFVLTTLGSLLGTWVGGAHIARHLVGPAGGG